MFCKPLSLCFIRKSNLVPSTALNFRFLHVVRTVEEMRKYHKEVVKSSTLGFVPTMGALHSGHIMLMERARKENDFVAASIFVNPTQFSAGEDLDKYPRQFEADCELLRKANVDVVFAPLTSEMYKNDALCHVEPTAFGSILEGKARPEFFRGVATVVCKLFNIVDPSKSYFGQKDISQCILIRKLVEDLHMRGEIIVCETKREEDGLAMSSRNAYLTPDERKEAAILYRALSAGKELCKPGTTIETNTIIAKVTEALQSNPLIKQVEYVSVASHKNMKELDAVQYEAGAVLSSAVRLGNVRLIDNLLIGNAEKQILN